MTPTIGPRNLLWMIFVCSAWACSRYTIAFSRTRTAEAGGLSVPCVPDRDSSRVREFETVFSSSLRRRRARTMDARHHPPRARGATARRNQCLHNGRTHGEAHRRAWTRVWVNGMCTGTHTTRARSPPTAARHVGPSSVSRASHASVVVSRRSSRSVRSVIVAYKWVWRNAQRCEQPRARCGVEAAAAREPRARSPGQRC